MLALVRENVILTKYIRILRGGSQPILAEASDGCVYVVKFANNLQGPNLTFNESVASELYRALELPVAPWKVLQVSDEFIERNPACWIQTSSGRLRPSAGWCFGSRFLGQVNFRLFEVLPYSSFKRVQNLKDFWLAWLVDICARHTDHRQAIFEEGADGHLRAVFVDHGHMFCGAGGNEQRHFRASAYLDSRVYPTLTASSQIRLREAVGRLNADVLWTVIDSLPDDWKTKSALQSFAKCLEMLSNTEIVRSVVDTMVDYQRHINQREQLDFQTCRKPPMQVLRPGIQTAERKRVAVA